MAITYLIRNSFPKPSMSIFQPLGLRSDENNIESHYSGQAVRARTDGVSKIAQSSDVVPVHLASFFTMCSSSTYRSSRHYDRLAVARKASVFYIRCYLSCAASFFFQILQHSRIGRLQTNKT